MSDLVASEIENASLEALEHIEFDLDDQQRSLERHYALLKARRKKLMKRN